MSMTEKVTLLLRTTLIAAALGFAAPAYAQVRVITGDVEHVYGAGGQLLDDEELRAKNERAETARRLERDRRRQEEADAEYLRLKAEADQAAATANEEWLRYRSIRGWN
jgi:hypothetical protein